MGGEADLTEGLISEEHGKNKSRFGNSGLQVLPSWRGGNRAQTSPDCCCRSLFASGLVSRLSLHTLAIPERKKKKPTKNIIWLSFGKNCWGKRLVLNLQDLTFISVKKSLRNRNLPYFFFCLCVCICDFLRGQSPTQGENIKNFQRRHG